MILHNLNDKFLNKYFKGKGIFIKIQIIALTIFLLASITIFFTPKNEGQFYKQRTNIYFSKPGGVYKEPIRISLKSKLINTEIRYTVDGTEPQNDSLIFENDLEINKTTIIRSRLYKNGEPVGDVHSNSYIIGRNFNMPVISIVTDPDNLWSLEKGIYHINNFQNSGKEWERPAFLQFFDTNDYGGFSLNLAFRIHGGSTRRNPQKGLRITARNKYETSLIKYPIFPNTEITSFKNLLLRASGNDWGKTMMKDALLQYLVEDLKLDAQMYRPSVVYLNGEYWGIHNIREYFDEQYFKNHYGAERGTVVILHPERSRAGYPSIEEGKIGDELPYVDMIDFMKNNDLSIEENYLYVSGLMDIDNFIDYYLSQLYFGNDDWLYHNLKVWRFKSDKYEPNARYGLDGKWRWLLYDTDHGFHRKNNNLLQFTDFPTVIKHDFSTVVIKALLSNENFKYKFINRYADLLNYTFLPDVVISKIDEYAGVIEPEMPYQIERWGNQIDRGGELSLGTIERWNEELQDMRDFALLRPDITREHFIERFKLGGKSYVYIETEGKGKVTINTLEISDFPKNLVYFRKTPVPIKATPNFGYKFVGWETKSRLRDDVDKSNNSVTLLSESAYIKVVFKRTFIGKILGL